MTRAVLAALCWLDRKCRAAAIRLNGGIHPKHNVGDDRHRWWSRHVRGGRVLDLGCGTGAHAVLASRTGARIVVGLDTDQAALKIADARGARHCFFAVWDATHPVPSDYDGKFGLVLCLDVLEHVEDRAALLGVARGALATDGVLALTAPNRETTWRRRLRAAGLDARYDADHRIEYVWDELEGELKDSGFRVVERLPIVYDDGPVTGLKDLLGAVWPAWYRQEMARRVARAYKRPEESKGWAVIAEVA